MEETDTLEALEAKQIQLDMAQQELTRQIAVKKELARRQTLTLPEFQNKVQTLIDTIGAYKSSTGKYRGEFEKQNTRLILAPFMENILNVLQHMEIRLKALENATHASVATGGIDDWKKHISTTQKTPYWRSNLRNVSLWIKPETLPEGWVMAQPNENIIYYNIFTDETAKTIPEIRELEKNKLKQ
jgi:uncharacterized membrane protein YccC